MHRQNRQMHQNARLSRLMLHTPWKETDTSSYAKRCAQTSELVTHQWRAGANSSGQEMMVDRLSRPERADAWPPVLTAMLERNAPG